MHRARMLAVPVIMTITLGLTLTSCWNKDVYVGLGTSTYYVYYIIVYIILYYSANILPAGNAYSSHLTHFQQKIIELKMSLLIKYVEYT